MKAFRSGSRQGAIRNWTDDGSFPAMDTASVSSDTTSGDLSAMNIRTRQKWQHNLAKLKCVVPICERPNLEDEDMFHNFPVIAYNEHPAWIPPNEAFSVPPSLERKLSAPVCVDAFLDDDDDEPRRSSSDGFTNKSSDSSGLPIGLSSSTEAAVVVSIAGKSISQSSPSVTPLPGFAGDTGRMARGRLDIELAKQNAMVLLDNNMDLEDIDDNEFLYYENKDPSMEMVNTFTDAGDAPVWEEKKDPDMMDYSRGRAESQHSIPARGQRAPAPDPPATPATKTSKHSLAINMPSPGEDVSIQKRTSQTSDDEDMARFYAACAAKAIEGNRLYERYRKSLKNSPPHSQFKTDRQSSAFDEPLRASAGSGDAQSCASSVCTPTTERAMETSSESQIEQTASTVVKTSSFLDQGSSMPVHPIVLDKQRDLRSRGLAERGDRDSSCQPSVLPRPPVLSPRSPSSSLPDEAAKTCSATEEQVPAPSSPLAGGRTTESSPEAVAIEANKAPLQRKYRNAMKFSEQQRAKSVGRERAAKGRAQPGKNDSQRAASVGRTRLAFSTISPPDASLLTKPNVPINATANVHPAAKTVRRNATPGRARGASVPEIRSVSSNASTRSAGTASTASSINYRRNFQAGQNRIEQTTQQPTTVAAVPLQRRAPSNSVRKSHNTIPGSSSTRILDLISKFESISSYSEQSKVRTASLVHKFEQRRHQDGTQRTPERTLTKPVDGPRSPPSPVSPQRYDIISRHAREHRQDSIGPSTSSSSNSSSPESATAVVATTSGTHSSAACGDITVDKGLHWRARAEATCSWQSRRMGAPPQSEARESPEYMVPAMPPPLVVDSTFSMDVLVDTSLSTAADAEEEDMGEHYSSPHRNLHKASFAHKYGSPAHGARQPQPPPRRHETQQGRRSQHYESSAWSPYK